MSGPCALSGLTHSPSGFRSWFVPSPQRRRAVKAIESCCPPRRARDALDPLMPQPGESQRSGRSCGSVSHCHPEDVLGTFLGGQTS